jgi:hypothetical protein
MERAEGTIYTKPILSIPQLERLHLESNCTLCNHELEVEVQYIEDDNGHLLRVVEAAFCLECNVRVRRRSAPVH